MRRPAVAASGFRWGRPNPGLGRSAEEGQGEGDPSARTRVRQWYLHKKICFHENGSKICVSMKKSISSGHFHIDWSARDHLIRADFCDAIS